MKIEDVRIGAVVVWDRGFSGLYGPEAQFVVSKIVPPRTTSAKTGPLLVAGLIYVTTPDGRIHLFSDDGEWLRDMREVR